jgi:hypothetical protein
MNAAPEYVLLDQLSMNQLGEFATFEEAEEVLLRYVAADARAAEHLEIWLEDDRLPVDPDKLRRASAA